MFSIVKKGPFRTTKFRCLLRVCLVPHSRTPFERKGARPHDTLALVIGHCLPRCLPYRQTVFKHITRLPNNDVQLYLESESGGSLMVGAGYRGFTTRISSYVSNRAPRIPERERQGVGIIEVVVSLAMVRGFVFEARSIQCSPVHIKMCLSTR